MPLQDLTPQLRTRLSRMERAVGWFVTLAAILLLAGFADYLYTTAKDRGWFLTKLNYSTSLGSAAGIKAGDPVKLMGFNVGEITDIQLNDPNSPRGVTIFFWVKEPYPGYIWLDSQVRVSGSSLMGGIYLELEKGKTGAPTAFQDKNKKWIVMVRRHVWEKYKTILKDLKSAPENKDLTDFAIAVQATNMLNKAIKADQANYYTNAPLSVTNWIPPIDAPALADRLDAIVASVEVALPNFLRMTNQLAAVLDNANHAVARLDSTLADTHPIMTNLTVITGNLRDPQGSLGNWLIPTDLRAHLDQTLQTANTTLASARTTLDSTDTNLTAIATDLDKSLENLANLTSNLNWQVQANTNLVTDINAAIVHTDDLIQGLKHHWLLRSAFKPKKTNQEKATLTSPNSK